jgi:hypothetical protein
MTAMQNLEIFQADRSDLERALLLFPVCDALCADPDPFGEIGTGETDGISQTSN